MSTEVVVVDPSSEKPFAEVAAEVIEALAAEHAGPDGRCSIALAGGSTPRAVYQALARRKRLPARTAFYFGDERCAPPEDPESNYRMAREALSGLASVELHRIEAERPDRDAAARDYEKVLPRELSVLVLGIGEDGHTASLFPGSPALHERTRRVLVIEDAPKPPRARLTITPPVIEAARSIVVLATGAGKTDAVARALEGARDQVRTPAQLARRGTWVLDEAAAAKLEKWSEA